MNNICTLSDKNYALYGLCLYESLLETTNKDFMLHYLCLDDETMDIMDLPQIKSYHINDYKKFNDFEILRQNNKSTPNGLSSWHFALASYFVHKLINVHHVNNCLYVDSDIMFYNDVSNIISECDKHSVGLMTHKHMTYRNILNKLDVGYYNVGLVFFNNDEYGIFASDWWKNVVITPNNIWHDSLGQCWDQKYLEGFHIFLPNNRIFVIDTIFGHGAPWNYSHLKFDYNNNKLKWIDDVGCLTDQTNIYEQDLYFIHFSHFTPDFPNDKYNMDRSGEFCNTKIQNRQDIKWFYDDYFDKLKKIKQKYGI
ncbi:MAG: hypothetical protein BAJALOKI3v1_50074 [Promethearchaeota archaeon]|nr:MAG: hypothetical protein BAJALOKI3v1_50074 [Candidatus Lokiarchaeota archaeon]